MHYFGEMLQSECINWCLNTKQFIAKTKFKEWSGSSFSCMSSIDRIGFPFIKKYLKKSIVENRGILCIILCDSVHCKGYNIDLYNSVIVHVDSLRQPV